MSARPGLCGGQPAMVVPTAISKPLNERYGLFTTINFRIARDPEA
jgi:hypothetical protein